MRGLEIEGLILPRFWSAQPLSTSLVELLHRKRGAIMDMELFKALKKVDGDLSFRAFNKTLMKLEIDGIIHVYGLKRNRRSVELAPRD